MNIQVEGKLAIENKVNVLLGELRSKRKANGFVDPDFDVLVMRYLGMPASVVAGKLVISALDLIALSLSHEEGEKISEELKAFQELVEWSQRLNMDLPMLSGLLSIGHEKRKKQIQSQENIPAEQAKQLLDKFTELEGRLSVVDKMIAEKFPSKLNQPLALVLSEVLEQLNFDAQSREMKQLNELRRKSMELFAQLAKATPADKASFSRQKADIDAQILKLFVEFEPKREIRAKLISWIFAEDSWSKLSDEKYLWTLLGRMVEVSSRQCNMVWALSPGQTNLIDLVVNMKWPDYLNQAEVMQNTVNAVRRIVSFPIPQLSAQFVFDPFKVNWDLVEEIALEFEKYKVQMYRNCMQAYSDTIKEMIAKTGSGYKGYAQ